jgi:hypothetical protein
VEDSLLVEDSYPSWWRIPNPSEWRTYIPPGGGLLCFLGQEAPPRAPDVLIHGRREPTMYVVSTIFAALICGFFYATATTKVGSVKVAANSRERSHHHHFLVASGFYTDASIKRKTRRPG